MLRNRKCTLGVFPALAFVADFLPAAPEFLRRTHRVRLRNLVTTPNLPVPDLRCASLPAPAFISAAAAATLILNPFLHQDTIWKRSCIPKLPALKKESSPIYAGITAVTFTPSESMPQGTTGTQTGLRMKTIIGIIAMSATKKKMFPCTRGIAVRSSFLQPVQHQGKKYTPVLYAATE